MIGAPKVPAVPFIERRGGKNRDACLICSLDDGLLIAFDAATAAFGAHVGTTAAANDKGSRRFIDAGTVVPGLFNRKSSVRGINLHCLARTQAAEVDGDVARGDTQLQEVRLLILDSKLGVFGGANEGPATDL
jgi:hypothetical protein